jgi:hypothetical protein
MHCITFVSGIITRRKRTKSPGLSPTRTTLASETVSVRVKLDCVFLNFPLKKNIFGGRRHHSGTVTQDTAQDHCHIRSTLSTLRGSFLPVCTIFSVNSNMSQRAGCILSARVVPSVIRSQIRQGLAAAAAPSRLQRYFRTSSFLKMEQGVPPPRQPTDTIFGKIIRKEIGAKVRIL